MRRHLHHRPASTFKRAVAYMIDVMPIQLVLYLVSVMAFDVSPITDELDHPKVQASAAIAASCITYGTLGIWIVYCILGELSPWRGTFGKKLMGITVKSAYGGKLTARQVVIRNLSKVLSAIPCYLGFFWAIFTHGNRAWHDSLSATSVTDR